MPFCLFEALCRGLQFCSHFWTTSWAWPVLSDVDEVSCSRTQHCAPGEDRTHDLAIKESDAHPTELSVLPLKGAIACFGQL